MVKKDEKQMRQLTYSGGDNPFVMVRVHTDAVVFEVKGKLAELAVFQLVLVQVRPPPYSGIHHVWEALSTGHLSNVCAADVTEQLSKSKCIIMNTLRNRIAMLVNKPAVLRSCFARLGCTHTHINRNKVNYITIEWREVDPFERWIHLRGESI